MTEITGKLSAALADRYRIESHLGEGGMATVYLAEDLKHHRKGIGDCPAPGPQVPTRARPALLGSQLELAPNTHLAKF